MSILFILSKKSCTITNFVMKAEGRMKWII